MAHRSSEASQEPRGGGEGELMPSPTWAARPPPLPPELWFLEAPVWSWLLGVEGGRRGVCSALISPSLILEQLLTDKRLCSRWPHIPTLTAASRCDIRKPGQSLSPLHFHHHPETHYQLLTPKS